MTHEEAVAIAKLIGAADSCSQCVRALCQDLTSACLGWAFRPADQERDGIEESRYVEGADHRIVVMIAPADARGLILSRFVSAWVA